MKIGIVLGHGIINNKPSSRLKKRLDKAADLLTRKEVDYIVTTGGFGPLFNRGSKSMASVSKDYLKNKNILSDSVIVEDKSKTTVEDAKLSLDIVKRLNTQEVYLITSWPHIIRAQYIFKRMYPKEIEINSAISDIWSGLWTFWDWFWEVMGWLKLIKNKTARGASF